ncbi:hypothetical protein N7462_008784 [Penicillium macrosclerotiorum]|uniref:uncharacterized protein n=1 Tax=Penicillium macrosclerotiorum TaxID=303699 RepID=UPI002547FA0B|nr:uncharacterized protein N7462_008784 [Penicillium macrosclerotiorum]KAJ5675887.1 hypothetical protein N7462_008784 [Penicillium macrosclerotiorum]
MAANVSNDLIWLITRNQNASLVRRNTGGGSQLSRDSLNLVNKHSFKYSGLNTKVPILTSYIPAPHLFSLWRKPLAFRLLRTVASSSPSRSPETPQQPASNWVTVTYGPKTSTRKIYKGVANLTARYGYRADLREEAVARVSAVRRSQRPKKDTAAPKLRGAKAQAAQKDE